MSHYTIHPIVLGTKVFDKGMMTYQHGYGTPFTIPIYAWLIKGASKNILVDTGEAHPVVSEDRERAIGGKIYTFEEGLAKHGLKPEDIDIVLHTHLHSDHCENDYKCTNAKFYVHEKELHNIHNPHPLDFRYLEDHIEEIEANGQIVVLKTDIEILPGIRMVRTPAHTRGGMSVIVDTAVGSFMICGFCTILENLYPPAEVKAMEMEVIPPGTNTNAKKAYNILVRAKTMADYLLPLHEPKYAAVEQIPANIEEAAIKREAVAVPS
ncbi:N-acyl homoserine lactonase family protein [Salidesulfovibrio onnuriiensis]|uniref:N-acyl homoserine lactonase family protein n=1 Tax=Salidesulfovibrio onnuriiensis TaxID=2583823 RepID=UPI0011CBDACB|nr:N-acyl homoserine lactonase family protein [Salidesulfovibrio onnuriiensis]